MKELNKWGPQELTKKKKIIILKCHLLYAMQQQWNISWSEWDVQWKVDFIQQLVMASSVARLRRSSKTLPKAKLTPRKIKVTVWWSAVHLIHYSFLNPGLHLRSMLSKSMRCTKICKGCGWHWWTEWAQYFSTTMPGHILNNQCFKSWTNWAMKFCLICHIHLTSCQLTTILSSILTIFCRENSSTTSRRQKMLSKSLLNANTWIFTLQE